MTRSCIIAALVVCLGACGGKAVQGSADGGGGSDGGGTDAGSRDGGGTDAGSRDGGSDAGAWDAGPWLDAGCSPDALWLQDVCAVLDCTGAIYGQACLVNGSLGQCYAGACQVVSTQTDPENCEAWHASCVPGAVCREGNCSIGCGSVCADAGMVCGWGNKCVVSTCSSATPDFACLANQGDPGFCCGNTCIDLWSNDSQNCGGCGHACPPGDVCDHGQCIQVIPCGPSNNGAACSRAVGGVGTCCNGSCVDLRTDLNNCGSCGNACPSGSACYGYCTIGPPLCSNE